MKQERERFNTLYTETSKKLSKAVLDNSYPVDLGPSIDILMAKEISDCFWTFVRTKEKTSEDKKLFLYKINTLMKEELSKIDDEIKKQIEM